MADPTRLNAGHFDEAGALFESAVERFRRMDDPGSWLARTLVNLGVIRIKFDRHDETIALCQEAAQLLERAIRTLAPAQF